MHNNKRMTALAASALFAIGSLAGAACSDEDGDGGTTDEEIEDVEDTADSIGDEIQEEIDSQDEGTNRDGE